MSYPFFSNTLRAAILGFGLAIVSPCYISADHTSYVLPSSVAGVKNHVINLNGKWELQTSADKKWRPVEVPGEVAMQGFAIAHDEPFTYRHTFKVPADFKGKTMILRFDGTYSYATLTINGHKVRDHRGGFTRWETDVTKWIKPGKNNTVELTLVDPVEEISYASGYAHHPVGGILRDVTLFAIPNGHISELNIQGTPDSSYTTATAKISFNATGNLAGKRMDIRLTTPSGNPLPTVKTPIQPGLNNIEIPLGNAQLWDAEHPNLYHVAFDIFDENLDLAETFGRKFGVRDVKTAGNRLLVNGKPVKLRGACRHDMHPTLGRSTNAELDSLDARLFKEANMNFVRTSHYPPSEKFAEMCDKYGIYIECETAVCFVDTYRQRNYAPGASQNDQAHTGQYLSQVEEMASTFVSHPSVIFWSIGNESVYGTNFDLSMKALRKADPTRPIIFSYPGTVPADSTSVYDLLSFHYPGVSGNMNQWGKRTTAFNADEGKPALYDEWAHPACYTYATLQEDPGIREFWGHSIEKLWDGVYTHTGALGGAIWGYIDERFMLPEPKIGSDYWREFAHTAKPEGFRGKCVGYGDWGIVDIWRRKKPEFAATKRGYSPVRLQSGRIINPIPGSNIRLTVSNRFDHTDLNEIKCTYSYMDKQGSATLGDAKPGQNGLLTIPPLDWKDGENLTITFTDNNGDTIDSYLLSIGSSHHDIPASRPHSRGLTVERNDNMTTITGDGFTIPVDSHTGLITNATFNGKNMIGKGPYLHAYINYNHLTGAEVREISDHLNLDSSAWNLKRTTVSQPDSNGNVSITILGSYGNGIEAEFNITVTPAGEMHIDYAATGLPEGYARATGLKFDLADGYDSLSWEREGILDIYPEYSMSGNIGHVALTNGYNPAYGERPLQPWADDTRDYYYWSDNGSDVKDPLRMSAKSLKENIYHYTLHKQGNQLSVIDKGAATACRISRTADGDKLFIDNTWDYPEIAWGNYCKAISALPVAGSATILMTRE